MNRIVKIISVIILGVSSGQAVSRVGGGKVRSQSSGFEATLPNLFGQLTPLSSDSVRAMGPAVYIAGFGPSTQFVDISEFASEFPDGVLLSREDLRQRFLAAEWTEGSMTEACVLQLQNRSSNQVAAMIVTWGQGRGFVLKGPRLPEVEAAMQSILQSLKLDVAGCSWK